MRKKILIILAMCLLLQVTAFADTVDIKDAIIQNPLFPSEYSLSTDYNPDSDREWTFNEICNKFAWKFKDKPSCFIPDGVWISVDYSPNSVREWRFSEVTTGVTYKLK